MYVLLDVETTGLPNRRYGKFDDYKNLDSYNHARIVQISFLFSNFENLDVEDDIIFKNTFNYIIKRDGFDIKNAHIHGITNEISDRHGIDIMQVLHEMIYYFRGNNVKKIICHNIEFDINVILSELYRYQLHEHIEYMNSLEFFCSMKKTTRILKLKNYKWPTLKELYLFSLDDDNATMENQHDSKFDVFYLFKSLSKLLQRNLLEL